MPHVIVKMVAGASEQAKQTLADAITQVVMKTLRHDADAVSVSIEEFAPQNWAEKVYRPDINDKPEHLYKKPGYNPL